LCFAGVAVGAGRQSVVAYINIGCYFLIGVPVGCLLGYVADLGITVRRFFFFFVYINIFLKNLDIKVIESLANNSHQILPLYQK
jgi:Na+-driven multidrug efflux pump